MFRSWRIVKLYGTTVALAVGVGTGLDVAVGIGSGVGTTVGEGRIVGKVSVDVGEGTGVAFEVTGDGRATSVELIAEATGF